MLPNVREVLGRTNPRTYEREKSKSNMTAFPKALSKSDPNDPGPGTIP